MCVGKWLVRMSTFMKVRDAAHFSSPCSTPASVCLHWKMSKFCLSSNVFLNTLLAHFVGHIVVTIVCVKIINFFFGSLLHPMNIAWECLVRSEHHHKIKMDIRFRTLSNTYFFVNIISCVSHTLYDFLNDIHVANTKASLIECVWNVCQNSLHRLRNGQIWAQNLEHVEKGINIAHVNRTRW